MRSWTLTRAYLLGACLPRKILNLHVDPLRLQSGTRLLFNTCDKTTITMILNFRISEGKNCGTVVPSMGPCLLLLKKAGTKVVRARND